MAGLGLVNALGSYQQGVQWRQQQDLIAEQKAKRDRLNAANQAGSEVLKQAQAQHEAEQAAALVDWNKKKGSNEGFQATPFRMTEGVMLNALDARGALLGKSGDWDDWMANEAKAAPLREQVRTKTFDAALNQYDMDGDPIALAEKVYPAIYDGRKIVRPIVGTSGGKGGGAATNAALAESNAKTGLAGVSSASEAGPETIQFELSDGSKTKPITHEQLVERVKWASLNPSQVRDYEIKQRLQAAKLEFERNKAAASGKEARLTEEVKNDGRKGLATLLQDREDARAEADRKSAEKRAGISAGATRYSADKGLEAAKVRTTEKAPKKMTDNEIRDAVVERFGSMNEASFSGKRNMTQLANDMVLDVREILDANPDADLTRAIAAAAKLRGATVSDK